MIVRLRTFPPILRCAVWTCGIVALCTTQLQAQPFRLAISTDEDALLAGLASTDHAIAATNLSGSWLADLTSLTGQLPPQADIDALDYFTRADIYFSLDALTRIDGTFYGQGDVIYWDGVSLSLAWSGTSNGLPPGADLDALDVIAQSPLEFSFSLDVRANLIGVGLTDDEDMIRFIEGVGFIGIDFDGSLAGIPSGADLNAFNRRSSDVWLVSFDSAGSIAAIEFDDADLLVWEPALAIFSSLFFNSRDPLHAIASGVDLDAAEATPGEIAPITQVQSWQLYGQSFGVGHAESE